MPSMQEIRQKYPQYDDMSDQEFADKFHDKFYSDMPKEEFYKKLSFSPKVEEKKQPESLLKKSGSYAKQYINEPLEELGRESLNVGAGAGQGLANTGVGVRNLLAKGANLLPGVNIPMEKSIDIAPHNINTSLGDLLGMLAGGGLVSRGTSAAASHIQDIPQIANYLKKASDIIGKSPIAIQKSLGALKPASKNALVGAAVMPEDQGLGAAIGGAGTIAGHGIANVAPKVIELLKPTNIASKLFPAKDLSNEQLLENLKIAEGTNTSLGQVLQEPFLTKQYENVLSKVPLSGATQKLQSSASEVVNRGNNILNKLLGENNPENVTQQVSDTLVKQFNKHQKEKSNLYKNVNELASKSGLKLELPTFSDKAKLYRNAIESSNILKYEPDISKIFNKLSNYINPVKESQLKTGVTRGSLRSDPITGKPIVNIKYPTLQEANLLKGKLNQYAQLAGKSPDPAQRGLSKIYSDLSKSLKSDIEKSIDYSGNVELKNAYTSAEENYKKHFSPFLDKEIYKHISGQKDPDMIINDFLKTSKSTDRSNKLSKLTSKLPDKQQKLIGYSYLSRALDKEGKLDPHKLSILINNLGKKQLNILIPDKEIRNELTNFSKLYKMNIKGLDLMKNPPTGQQAMDVIPGLLAHAGSSYAGGLLGGLPGAIAGIAVPGLISKPIVNALTSPEFREKTIKSIIKRRSNKSKNIKKEEK